MHNKFCVIDGIIVYTGSFNHTNSATIRNDKNYIVIRDKEKVLQIARRGGIIH